ncbi:hypothetical protein A2U01_0038082, partial [Trifolium medium]|nr:hypothetical protein [Trifolium medium]
TWKDLEPQRAIRFRQRTFATANQERTCLVFSPEASPQRARSEPSQKENILVCQHFALATLKRTKSEATQTSSPALRSNKPKSESRFGSKVLLAQGARTAKMQVGELFVSCQYPYRKLGSLSKHERSSVFLHK